MHNLSRSILYEDKAASGWILKLVFLILPAVLIIAGLYLWYSSQDSGNLGLVIVGIIIGLVLWFILPRKYQVFEDHLRIVFVEPIALVARFNQIASIEVTTRTALTVNLVSRIAKAYVIIVKRKGLSIAITPEHSDLFVENANRALNQWKKNNAE